MRRLACSLVIESVSGPADLLRWTLQVNATPDNMSELEKVPIGP